MPFRKVLFANGEYYHVFNRGVGQMAIFLNKFDYKRFLKTTFYYQIKGSKPRFSIFAPTTNKLDASKKIVEIVAYCIMPNHFHFLLRQETDGGIIELVRKLCNSYAKYFNIKNHRVGPLFQGEFKAVHIETEEQLIHLSRYIHLNPLVGFVTSDLESYRWSSYKEFLRLEDSKFCLKDVVLNRFKSINDYKEFIISREDYGKKLEMIKHQLID
ncbi:transposase [Candidatus Curtissbacteria bacterium]|nr:transposase [Candidatus Curtissbacteria bacterium]